MTFALCDDMSLNIEAINDFIDKYRDSPTISFGFTYIVWKHFICQLEENQINVDLSKNLMIHGGGWKKLESESHSVETFKKKLKKTTSISQCHNYYGMVEQTGSIFIECEHGYLHTSIWSDIIIRNQQDFTVLDIGEMGLVQLLSLIPRSYPGHSILSEDLGTVIGEDDCKCGRLGKYFLIHGRLPKAEVRGCSDTYSG